MSDGLTNALFSVVPKKGLFMQKIRKRKEEKKENRVAVCNIFLWGND